MHEETRTSSLQAPLQAGQQKLNTHEYQNTVAENHAMEKSRSLSLGWWSRPLRRLHESPRQAEFSFWPRRARPNCQNIVIFHNLVVLSYPHLASKRSLFFVPKYSIGFASLLVIGEPIPSYAILGWSHGWDPANVSEQPPFSNSSYMRPCCLA